MAIESDGETPIRTKHEMMEAHDAPGREPGDSSYRRPEAGETILTSEGKHFGSVKQVHGGYIEVDREGDPDYWLSSSYIVSNDGEKLYLRVPMEEADIHRLRQPGIDSLHTRQAGVGTTLQSDQEALRMREMMEAELLAQRGTMDTGLRHTN